MRTMLKNQLTRARDADVFSQERYSNEAQAWGTMSSLIQAWDDLAKDSRNKTDWNNFAKYVLNEVQEIRKIIDEVKNG